MKLRTGAILCVVLILCACSGGGGGGSGGGSATSTPVSASSISEVLGTVNASSVDPTAAPSPSTASFSVSMFPLTSSSTQSPTAVSFYSDTYNFSLGVPDTRGPGFVGLFSGGSYTLPNTINVFGQSVSGSCSSGNCATGATLLAPNSDVLAAWQKGWTGKGINVLINDDVAAFNDRHAAPADRYHMVTTTLIAGSAAPGATLYGLDMNALSSVIALNGNTVSGSGISFGVINASFGGTGPCSVSGASPCSSVMSSYQDVIDTYTNRNAALSGFSFIDATITKSAGNDNTNASTSPVTALVTADKEPISYALLNSPTNAYSTQQRTILVGSIEPIVGRSGYAIADYSEIAGWNTYSTATSSSPVFTRFLVELDTTPFTTIGVNASNLSSSGNVGTSYAAPRVAGDAAILRQEFPNLTGAQTSNVLLATASYANLYVNSGGTWTACSDASPSVQCEETFGMGQARLSRAMAPIGNIRAHP